MAVCFATAKFTFQGLMPCTAFCGMVSWKARRNCPAFQIDMTQKHVGGRTCWKVNLRLMNKKAKAPPGRCYSFLSVATPSLPSAGNAAAGRIKL